MRRGRPARLPTAMNMLLLMGPISRSFTTAKGAKCRFWQWWALPHQESEACLTFYDFPKEHWKTIRTNNVIERLFEEVKRRSHKMAAAFRNEGSCVLLFYAVIRSLKFHKLTMPVPSKEQPGSEILHNT